MTTTFNVRYNYQPYISVSHQLTYSGFVSRSVTRKIKLNVEKIRWDTTRRNSGILRPMQKRVHNSTCEIFNLRWKFLLAVGQNTILPENLNSIVMEYLGSVIYYRPGSTSLSAKGVTKRAGTIDGCESCFELPVKLSNKDKILVSFATPRRIIGILDAVKTKRHGHLHFKEQKKGFPDVSVTLEYDEACSSI